MSDDPRRDSLSALWDLYVQVATDYLRQVASGEKVEHGPAAQTLREIREFLKSNGVDLGFVRQDLGVAPREKLLGGKGEALPFRRVE